MGNPNPSGLLPSEMIHEILSWLPVKSLCRFRCVSKPWRSLIYDPRFVKLHLNKTIENEHVFLQRQRLILTTPVEAPRSRRFHSQYVYSLNLNELLSYNDHDSLPTDLNSALFSDVLTSTSFSEERRGLYVVGVFHCNGLLFFQTAGKGIRILVNPATRATKILSRPPRLGGEYDLPNCLYGFGFDYSTDDYKVVNGQICWQNGDFGVQFSIYTLKAGSWRVIERHFPYNLLEKENPPRIFNGILLNGGLHWLMYKVGGDSTLRIVCLLLEEERVREIQLPLGCSYFIDNEYPLVELGVFREDKLYMTTVHDNRGNCRGDIWVMMEYGVRESWTRIRVVTPYCDSLRFCFWKNSHDYLVVCDGDLILYESKEEDLLELSIPGVGKVSHVGIYFESLVSLVDQQPSLQEPTPHHESNVNLATSLIPINRRRLDY